MQPISRIASLPSDFTGIPRAVRRNPVSLARQWLRKRADARVLQSLDASVARDIGIGVGWNPRASYAVDPVPLWGIGLTPQPVSTQPPNRPADQPSPPEPTLECGGLITRFFTRFGRGMRTLARARRRGGSYQCLDAADSRMLADLGVSTAQARYEVDYPIWGRRSMSGQ